MAFVEVVENPRRKRRRVKRARRVARRVARRRNPLAVLSNPRRRRQYRRRYPRRRNPVLGGLGIDLTAAAWVASGMLGVELMPGLVRRYWPALPTGGPLGYVVKGAAAILTGVMVGKLTRSPRNRNLAIAGGLSSILVAVFRDYAAGPLGLSGYVSDSRPLSLEDLGGGVGEYVSYGSMKRNGLGLYVEDTAPVGSIA